MTDRHDDESWAPEDDELVRQALLSLMDDVSAEPLPEPSQIRARAESGSVVDLDSRRRRRRSMAVLAGAAAAALVATGAGLLVVNQSPDTPVATSTSGQPTSTSSNSTSAAPSRLTTLGPAEWQTFLGVPIGSTVQGEPDTHCFQPSDDTRWVSRSARQPDGTRLAGQWVGTSGEGTTPLTAAVDQSVEDCDGWSRERSVTDTVSGDGTLRAWHAAGPDGATAWWVEVSDGDSVSFLSVPESDGHRYSDADIRTLALGVLGKTDLARQSSTSSTTTPPSSTSTSSSASSTSTSTSTSTSASSSTTKEPTSTSSGSSSSTSGSSTTRPTPPPNSPTPPDTSVPVVGTVDSKYFVPPSSWASQTLTGGKSTTGGTLELEGGLTIDSCVSTAADDPLGGVGVRSGPGEDNFFGRQYVFKDKTAHERKERHNSVLGSYHTNCSGTGFPEVLGEGRFKMTVGDATTYVAVTELGSGGTSIIQLNQPKTAPEPLTDATAMKELDRLSGLAARR